MRTRDQKMLDMAKQKAKYDMRFWNKVGSIAEKLKLKTVYEYADMKWRMAAGGSLTLIQTAMNIQAGKNLLDEIEGEHS